MSLRNSDPPGGWGSHRRSGSSLASRGSRGRQRRADPPASHNDAYTPRVHDSGSVGNISDGSTDPRPYPPPPVRSNSRPVRSSSQSVHSSGGASVAGISGAPSRFRAPPGLAPVDTDAPRRPTSAIRIYVHARGTPAEGTDFAYYFEDHTDARVSTLHTLLSEGGLTRFSRAYEGVGSFEMCKASFGQGVTHVDNVSLLPPSRTSDELLSVRATSPGGVNPPVPEVSYRGGRGPTASVVSLPSPTRNVPKFVPEDPSGGLDLGGGMDPGGSRPFSVPVVEDDASISSFESDRGWSSFRPYGTSALRPARLVRRDEASTGPANSGIEEVLTLLREERARNAELQKTLLGMEKRLADSQRESEARAAAERTRHDEAMAAFQDQHVAAMERAQAAFAESMRGLEERLACAQAQPTSPPALEDSPSPVDSDSPSTAVASGLSPPVAQIPVATDSRDLDISLETVPSFKKGDSTKTSNFITSFKMLMDTRPSYSAGEDGLLVTTEENKGRSGAVCMLLYSRVRDDPDVNADLKGEPQRTYLEQSQGFELFSWFVKKYGVKTEGTHLFGHLVKLFKAEQGSNTLSVFTGGLQESRNALVDGGMVIPNMMMVLFFLRGLNARKFGGIHQDFKVNQDKYVSCTLDELKAKALGLGRANLLLAGDACSGAPSASAARALRSRLPRPPGFPRLDSEMAALIERNLSGRDCIFCGDERHGLLVRPCKELLSRGIVVMRDPDKASKELKRVEASIKEAKQDGSRAIRASAAHIESGDWSPDGYDDGFEWDRDF